MIRTLIDTANKTVIVKQEFLIDELMEVLQHHNAWDYKIVIEKEVIKEYPPVYVPYTQPSKPWWEVDLHNPIMYHDGTGNPTPPFTTTSNTATLLGTEQTNFTK